MKLRKHAMKAGLQISLSASTPKQVTPGDLVRIVPNVEGLQFNVASLEFIWRENYHVHRLSARVAPDLAGNSLLGSFDVYVRGALVALLPIAVRIANARRRVPRKPKLKLASGGLFNKLFISYSRKDSVIVDSFLEIYTAWDNLPHR